MGFFATVIVQRFPRLATALIVTARINSGMDLFHGRLLRMRTGNDLAAPLAASDQSIFGGFRSLSLSPFDAAEATFRGGASGEAFYVACLAIFTCVFTLLTTGLQSHYCDASTMCGRRLHKFQRQASEREIFHIYSRIPSGRETKKMDSRHTSREP